VKPHPAGDPPEPLRTKATTTGVIKWYRKEKGYGCIASEKTAPWDIWFHYTMTEPPALFKQLEEGNSVEVHYERANQDSFRYRAIWVRQPK
jgi:CspA family cold shock protein